MQSLIFVIFTVLEKIVILKFLTHVDTLLANRPNSDHYTDSHFSCDSLHEKCCECSTHFIQKHN